MSKRTKFVIRLLARGREESFEGKDNRGYFFECKPNLSSLYLMDLMLISKSSAAFCFDPWDISKA